MTTPLLTLVVGAAGRHGGTGRAVLDGLRDAGLRVRALVRTEDARAARLRAEGVDVAVGDLADRAAMLAALDGCSHAYFTWPIREGVVPAAAAFASAARERRLSRIAVMSMAAAHPASPSPLGRAQWLADEVFQWSGVPCTILRVAALFHENLVLLHAGEIREHARFGSSFGEANVPWIGGDDAAALAVAALRTPERFPEAVAYPPGAELSTHRAIAEKLGAIVGRPIAYESLAVEAWTATLADAAGRDETGTLNAAMARHIAAVGGSFGGARQPVVAPDADALERCTGRRPKRLDEFLRDHTSDFGGDEKRVK